MSDFIKIFSSLFGICVFAGVLVLLRNKAMKEMLKYEFRQVSGFTAFLWQIPMILYCITALSVAFSTF